MRFIIYFIFSILLAACGGGGGGSTASTPSSSASTNQSLGGIWTGTYDGVPVDAATLDTGEIFFFSSDNQSGGGTAVVSGNSFSASWQVITDIGWMFEDGSTVANCSGAGTIIERQSFSLIYSCTTTLGTSSNSTASLNYLNIYDRDSSLSTIAGNYNDGGETLTVSSNGVIFEQSASTNCILNGTVGVINSNYNAYKGSITYSNCTGDYAEFNNNTYTGAAFLDNRTSPEKVVFALKRNNRVIIDSLPRL